MGGVDLSGALAGGRRGPQRRQRFTGHRGARAQHLGVGDAPARLAGPDAQPLGQRLLQRFADLLRSGLRGDAVDGLVLDHRGLAAPGFRGVEHREQIRHTQRIQRQVHQLGDSAAR